jgi:hypothetical protein
VRAFQSIVIALLGGGVIGTCRIPPSSDESILTRNTRVTYSLFEGGVGLIDQETESTTWVLLFEGRVGSTDDGIRSTTLSTESTEDEIKLTT